MMSADVSDRAVTAAASHEHESPFAGPDEAFEAAKQGMWIFLVTEVLMFGGLFVAYGIFRGLHADMFQEAHRYLAVSLGGTNTVVLILSSLTMALGVGATQRGQRDRALLFFGLTLLLASCFLLVKYFEYSHKFHEGLLPGGYFRNEHLKHPKAPLFFSLYFVMTGLHLVHVLVGMGLIAWLLKRTVARQFGPHYYTPVELVGFYWHFVDMVWIYLFPLLYLVG
ncbi:MAG: cytochrome c oxidase subunit 3 family protein [Oligoflexia bacterium]|nr:cytochrome c oxidase subunit 3 family protein [Oligoflexia bacterium]